MAPGSPIHMRHGISPDTDDADHPRAPADDDDYMADLRDFMVPSFDTPGLSSACSMPDTGDKPMQLGKTALSDVPGEVDVAPRAEQKCTKADIAHYDDATSSPSGEYRHQSDQKQSNSIPSLILKPGASAEPGQVHLNKHPNPCMNVASSTDEVSCDPIECLNDVLESIDALPSIPRSISKGGAHSGPESQSVGMTVKVGQLANMSPTDSISSPLLTPGTKCAQSEESNFKSQIDDAKTLSPTLHSASDDPFETGPLDGGSPLGAVSQSGIASTLSHVTPIASVQTKTVTRPCHPHSRIPSSTKKPQLQTVKLNSDLPAVMSTFSFSAHASSQEAVTPKGIGVHQIWDMGNTAPTAPKLHLTAAADEIFESEGSQYPTDHFTQQNQELRSQLDTGGMLVGNAIYALTPVANATPMSRPAQTTAPGSLHCHALARSEANQTAVSSMHPKSMPRPSNASRIPSRRGGSKSDQAAVNAACTPPTMYSVMPPGNMTNHLNLMPGSIERCCLPDSQPSDHPDATEQVYGPVQATAIGTPPFNRFIRYLNGPSKDVGSTSSSDKVVSDAPKEAVSPALLSTNELSSVSMCMAMTPDGRLFHQLMKGIQADQYCSPAVDCAAFHCMPEVDVVDASTVDPQPQDRRVSIPQSQDSSPSSIHSEIGENHVDEFNLEAVNWELAMRAFAAGDETSLDDGCCSRVSADGSAAGDATEHTVDLFTREAMRAFTSNGCCVTVHRSQKSKCDNACSLVEPHAAVAVTITEQDIESGQAKIHMAVSESTTADVPKSAAALSQAEFAKELSQDAVIRDSSLLQQDRPRELRDSTAISCTVNIGEITPTRDVADISSIPVIDPSDSPGTDVCNISVPIEGNASPSPSVLAAGADQVFSPPHLSISLESILDEVAAASTLQSMVVSNLNGGLQSPIKSLSPDHTALAAAMSRKSSPTADHIEIVKEMIRSRRLLIPGDQPEDHDADLSDLGTPQCTQMVKNIKGSFKTPESVRTDTPSSSMFPEFLDANGIGSALTPGGVPYCVVGGLWKQNRQIEREFQGWKAVELENAAETEQQHAYDIRKLQDENAAIVKKAVEAEHRATLLAEELDAARQELAETKRKLQCVLDGQLDASAGGPVAKDIPSANLMSASDETRLHGVVKNIKRLESLIERVCKRSCTQNNINTVFTQVYSYFHQLQVRLQSGRLRLTRSTRDTVDKVDALVIWAKPSLEELCEHYDTAASEVTRRSVDIARMRKSGHVAGDAVKQQQDENSHFHQHLEGVSVSMRFHLCEVFNRLHAVGEDLMTAMKNGQGAQVESAQPSDDANIEATSIEDRTKETLICDFDEPLSLLLGRRARNITNRLENVPPTLYSRSYSVQPCDDSHQGVQISNLQSGTQQCHATPRRNTVQGFPEMWLTTPPKRLVVAPTVGVGASVSCTKSGRPVLNMENPLFNATPETGVATSSDAPPSFAPEDSTSTSAEFHSTPSDSLDGLVTDVDDVQTTPARFPLCHSLSRDENSPRQRARHESTEASRQYPSKDRIEFICHALNMGISPFARRPYEA